MRSLRDHLATLLVCCMCLCFVPYSAAADGASSSKLSVDGNPYFPLAVGTSWTYRCSIEGRPQFEKTLRLTSKVRQGDTSVYKGEQRTGRDSKPLLYYFTTDSSGKVYRSASLDGKNRELLITRAPKLGDKVGALHVAAAEQMKLDGIGQIEALRVEPYSIDDPALPAAKRAEWRAQFYARDIGPVGEADGLGGECLITKLVKPKQP